jgi:hypothetical protein
VGGVGVVRGGCWGEARRTGKASWTGRSARRALMKRTVLAGLTRRAVGMGRKWVSVKRRRK